MAITPRKISAQDIVKVRVCSAQAVKEVKGEEVTSTRRREDGNGCRLISENGEAEAESE
jgi:hypothetical protein